MSKNMTISQRLAVVPRPVQQPTTREIRAGSDTYPEMDARPQRFASDRVSDNSVLTRKPPAPRTSRIAIGTGVAAAALTAVGYYTGVLDGVAASSTIALGMSLAAVVDGSRKAKSMKLPREEFIDVIRFNNIEMVKELLKYIDVKATTEDGETVLHLVAQHSTNKDIAKLFVQRGAYLNAFDNDGYTPLHRVAEIGNIRIAELLLEHDADPNNVKAIKHRTALHIAVEEGNVNMMKLLLDHNADPNAGCGGLETPLHSAALRGYPEIAQLLLERGAQPDASDTYEHTPLHMAASNGHADIVKRLIDAGAEKDAADRAGWTALHVAAKQGHREIVEMLIDRGADGEARNNAGMTALHVALDCARRDIARLLIEREVGIHVANEVSGETILHVAVRRGYGHLVRLLLEKGVEVDATDTDGHTALDEAAAYNLVNVAAVLIEYGAKVNMASEKDGWTPLHTAAAGDYTDMIELLIGAGAAIDAKTENGHTPWDLAVQRNSIRAIGLLEQHGASDEHGMSQLHYAAVSSDTDAVDDLLDAGSDILKTDADGLMPVHHALRYRRSKNVNHMMGRIELPEQFVSLVEPTPLRQNAVYRRLMPGFIKANIGSRFYGLESPPSQQQIGILRGICEEFGMDIKDVLLVAARTQRTAAAYLQVIRSIPHWNVDDAVSKDIIRSTTDLFHFLNPTAEDMQAFTEHVMG